MESDAEQRKQEQQQRVSEAFALADLISNRVGYLFTDKKKRSEDSLIQPWQMWPTLFDQPKPAEGNAADVHKIQMEAYAARWNKKRREQGHAERSHS